MTKHCPCGSRRLFARCCEPYLKGEKNAPTAEALMRSRYSAFHQRDIDYLVNTHHPDNRDTNERNALKQSHTQWLNLVVISTQKGQRKDQQGTVEFAAAYRDGLAARSGESIRQLHERSHFVKEAGQWFYTIGDMLPAYEPKRDQSCWCGSAKKFRQCHAKLTD